MSLSGEYFDKLYAAKDDPWGFTSRWYEQRKYALTLAMLPFERYRRGFEPGCSIGVLTSMLAERCDELVASDPSAAALDSAGSRVPEHVELRLGGVPEDWPPGSFDLIVCSEVGYYLDASDRERLVDRIVSSLEPGGHLIAVHWRRKVSDYPSDGAQVHECFAARLQGLAHYEDEFALLDAFGAPDASLVAPE